MTTLEEPDKGFAWIVLLCGFIINMILSGMARMTCFLYVGLIDAYGITRERASAPFILRNSVRFLAAPFVGALGQTFGIRTVTFCGGIVAAVGSVLCAFAPSMTWIVVFWGVVHGIGFALANTLFQVIIIQYFEKHRALASGIVLSGECLSNLLFPVMIDEMISEYGIFGCFMLLGGLFLHTLPPSLLLKSPPWVEFPETYARKREQILKFRMKEDRKLEKSFTSQKQLNEKISENSQLCKSLNEPLAANRFRSGSNQLQMNGLYLQTETKDIRNDVICILYRTTDTDEILYQSGMTKPQDGNINPAFVLDPDKNSVLTKQEKITNEATKPAPKKKDGFLQNLRKIPQLYGNPVYYLISLSVVADYLLLVTVTTVIVDYTRDKGIPKEHEAFVIYSLAIGDLIGRLSFGWLTDKKCMSLPKFLLMSCILQGGFISLLTLSESLVVTIGITGLYGISSGAIYTHIPVLVYKYVDHDNQSNAMGCVGLFASVASYGLQSLIGYFRDHIGSYDGLLYSIAAFSIFTGGLWQLVPFWEKVQEKHQKLCST